MKIFVIPPLRHLDLAHMGDKVYYALAHLYYQHKHYRQFFKAAVKRGDFVTLDNSAAEKSLVTEDILIEIVKDLKPSEVIAPDILFDKNKTLKALIRFIKRLKKENLNKVDVFAVPQGKTRKEWLECYKEMLNNPYVQVIGLSKISTSCFVRGAKPDQSIKEARNNCVRYLKKHKMLTKPVHCLGQGDPTEFLAYKGMKMLRSTDSCNPIWSAVNDIEFGKGKFKRVPTNNMYFYKELTQPQLELAKKNIKYLKERVKQV